MPLGAQLVELVGGVDAGECTGEFGQYVVFAFEHDSSGAVRVSRDALTNFESGGTERIGGDGDLVLGTNARCPSTTILYFCHGGKGTEGRR